LATAAALLSLSSAPALATTPDGQTPAEETICDLFSGASWGLCNAYCEAMDCDSPEARASDQACARVLDRFQAQSGGINPPCLPLDGTDTDGDSVPDDTDLCVFVSDPQQFDTDGDGTGDFCDNCPLLENGDQADADRDGAGDSCDICPDAPNTNQLDWDRDGFGDVCDNCPDDANPDQADLDLDGTGDACETEQSCTQALGTCSVDADCCTGLLCDGICYAPN
jgi:hypothetical protein